MNPRWFSYSVHLLLKLNSPAVGLVNRYCLRSFSKYIQGWSVMDVSRESIPEGRSCKTESPVSEDWSLLPGLSTDENPGGWALDILEPVQGFVGYPRQDSIAGVQIGSYGSTDEGFYHGGRKWWPEPRDVFEMRLFVSTIIRHGSILTISSSSSSSSSYILDSSILGGVICVM